MSFMYQRTRNKHCREAGNNSNIVFVSTRQVMLLLILFFVVSLHTGGVEGAITSCDCNSTPDQFW